jgi:predicted nucleic acid-binding protein
VILLDTDHCTVLFDERHRLHQPLVSKLNESVHAIGIPIIAIEEQLKGLLALIHRAHEPEEKIWPYRRLSSLLNGISQIDVVDFDQDAAQIAKELRLRKLRIGNQDLSIAAIAFATDSKLLTANLRDFRRIEDLQCENWLI